MNTSVKIMYSSAETSKWLKSESQQKQETVFKPGRDVEAEE